MYRYFMMLTLPFLMAAQAWADDAKPIRILFLGDQGHHLPIERFRQLQPVMAKQGIDLTYTEDVDFLNPQLLAKFDGLMIYANITTITPKQEKTLIDYVEKGGAFIPIHCASYCFLNSEAYIKLVGAQFQKHETGTFRVKNVKPEHPIMKGYHGFESWDETYTHAKHNTKGRTVLEVRMDGSHEEPWTWVRTQGTGRVFYTAWGHDARTFSQPGFHELLGRGIRWATKHDPVPKRLNDPFDRPFPVPEMTSLTKDVAPFTFVDVGKKIPNYTPGNTWGKQSEPLSTMQLPLSPAESIKHMVVPKGFHVELFVSEEQLGGKPICMTWDERGRLWVALTQDYPNELQPPTQGHDSIVICDDTDHDGKYDKVTVFARNLSIPTSISFAKGSVIVFDATQTIVLTDTDGDDQADTRNVLFGTWSMGDTHGGPSNMQYGLDNWIWAMQGYNPSVLKVGNETHRFRQGFFRFRPDGSELEFIRSTDNNTWGLGISEEGLIFGSTANRNPSVFMPIPNRYYEAVRGWAPSLVLDTIADTYLFKPITKRIRQVDQFGGYTAGAGHAIYTARNYPKEYWNRTAFVNGPTGHLVGTFVIRRDGSGFRSSSPFNLMASNDEWTAPIMSEVGPDGNVWMLDWYNYIVQHNPTPNGFQTGKGAAYETDLRDKTKGRIYRIVPDAKPGISTFSLANATPQQLVAALKHDTMLWRKHAQRLLVERGQTDVVPALIEMVKDESIDEIGLNVGVIHALWTLHGLGQLDGSKPDVSKAALTATGHKSAGVRRNAIQVLAWKDIRAATLILDILLKDSDPQVRLMAVLAWLDLEPSPKSADAIVTLLQDPINATDRWISDAATCVAAHNVGYFISRLSEMKEPTPQMVEIAGIAAQHYALTSPPDKAKWVFHRLIHSNPQLADAVVRGLAEGWPKDAKLTVDAALENDLSALLETLPPERRGVLVRLAIGWGSGKFAAYSAEIARSLIATIQEPKQSNAKRIAAAKELIETSDSPTSVGALLQAIDFRTPPPLAKGLFESLRASRLPATGSMIVEQLPTLTPTVRQSAIQTTLTRPDWIRALIDAIDKGTVQLTELSLDQQQSLARHPDPKVQAQATMLLKRGGSLPSADRAKVLEKLMPITKQKGDAVAGLVVFKAQCAKCHTHGSEGARIGPDLTGMAVHPKEEILTNIIDPNRSVEANFRMYTVSTLDGLLLNGLLASESRTAIELIDAEAKKHAILRDDIDTLTMSTKSLMPEGFESQITPTQMSDLLAFLTQRGKYLPLPLDSVATVASDRGMFNSKEATVERLIFDDWKPKVVDGVPFQLVDPNAGQVKNVIMLQARQGTIPPTMPRSVSLPCNAAAKAIHLLGGVSGWGFPIGTKGSVTMIVRLHYADGKTEEHPLNNGVHFADYIRRVDVPESKFAFDLDGRQIRALTVTPKREAHIDRIEFVKGPDNAVPIVMAVTIEAPK